MNFLLALPFTATAGAILALTAQWNGWVAAGATAVLLAAAVALPTD